MYAFKETLQLILHKFHEMTIDYALWNLKTLILSLKLIVLDGPYSKYR